MELSFFFEYELGLAGDVLARELLKVKPGETIVITADTESDQRVVNAIARTVFSAGGKPLVVVNVSPLGVGKAADPMLPIEALTELLKATDVWVELNNNWLLYSSPYDIAIRDNKKLRHMCLVGLDVDMFVRCIGRIDYPHLKAFQEKVTAMTQAAQHVRITTPAGEDVEFLNVPGREVNCQLGYADIPGSYFMAGQIGWSPALETINGVIVFDGSIVPPIKGLLKEPVRLLIQNGNVEKIEGGKEAVDYETWLRNFNHPRMLKLAHVCYGFNPGARLSGNILEDERVWGSTEWGLGQVGSMSIPGGISAPSHTDGICLDSSVWLDGNQILDRGKVVDPELITLAAKLGKG